MEELAVIDDPAVAEVSLDPIRSALLAELRQPASATMLANRLGLPRQKVNYHLKTLEQHGLVELIEERRKGNVNERILRATALSFVISPEALSGVQPDPRDSPDRFSARWLIAVAAALIHDVGALLKGAEAAGQKLATFALDGEIRFASAASRAAFVEELSQQIATLALKYHDAESVGGRKHRIVVALHPSLKASPTVSSKTISSATTATLREEEETP
ncbi:DNA-binding transcriptional ArsR family regulator [Psychromicrobium silvestre]|uniref:DNA-binding transcriptional ArsR family regulator n=1 Tax=Psychromicrobium silvestre TaxID=1645614 RepID=A0A7Y9S4G8_9MICC|nr:helix-turn-helix domain-containing protein [Psychromicrobium silvestre]NYE94413.1 DNA-binding transcriptional ArsR family regulator [Psychromicrobium silvestre]